MGRRQRVGGPESAPQDWQQYMSLNAPHTFARMTVPVVIPGNIVNIPYIGQTSFGLNAIYNATEFSSLYDQYRIISCTTSIFLRVDPGAQTASGAYIPRLFWYRDFDDSNVPSNLAEMRENVRCKMKPLNPYRPIVIKWIPNTLATMNAGYKPTFKQWLDASNLGVVHYGHKLAIDNLQNTNYSVEIENKVVFQCKNAR